MRIWLIKMLYRTLSPSEQWDCHKHLKPPSIDILMADTFDDIERNWLRSTTYKATRPTDDKPQP